MIYTERNIESSIRKPASEIVELFTARVMTPDDESDFYEAHGFVSMDDYYSDQYKQSIESQERSNYE